MKTWIRRSFRNRIFAAMLLTALAPLLLGGALMLRLQTERIETGLARQAEAQLADLEEALDALCRSCAGMTAQLADSTVVHSALHRGGGGSRTLYQVLYRTTEPLRDYARFDICGSAGDCLYTTGDTLPQTVRNPGWGLLPAAREGEGLVFRSRDGGDLDAAQAIRDYGGEILGYVTVSIDQSGFVRLFGGRYSSSCEVLLLDGQWRAIYYSRPAQAGETVEALRTQLLAGQPLAGADGNYRFFAAGPAEPGFTLLLQQPRTFHPAVMHTIWLISAFVGTLCVLLSLLCTWLLSRTLSQPVHQLDEAMGQVERGNFGTRLETGRADELGRLAASFNRMTEEYRANLERNLRRQRELTETKLRMMQALVENAILHGVADREEGYIKLWAEEQDGDLLLHVSDNGPGIPPEILEKLNSPDKRIEGGHLGLFNVDSIIRPRCGEGYGLSARSVPGEGSRVTLRLPIRREEDAPC